MSTLVFGGCVVAAVVWFVWRKKAPVFTCWLSLASGLLVGAGLLYSASHKIAGALANGADKGTNLLFGVGVPGIIAVICTLELVRVLSWRNRDTPHRIVHPILAFLAPALFVAAGGIFASAAGWLDSGVDLLPNMFASFTTR